MQSTLVRHTMRECEPFVQMLRILHKLGQGAVKLPHEIHQGKVPHLGRNSPRHQHMWGPSSWKHLGVLMDFR